MVAVRIPGVESIDPVAPARDPGVTASPDAFGAQIGTSATHFGDALSSLGALLYKKQEAAQDHVYQQGYQVDFAPAAQQARLDNQAAFPNGGPGTVEDLNQRLYRADEQTRAGLAKRGLRPTEAATHAVDGHFAGVQANTLSSGVVYANNANVEHLKTQTDATVNSLASSVMSGAVPVDKALEQIDQIAAGSGALFPGGTIDKWKTIARETVMQAGVDNAVAAKDPARARELNAKYFGGSPRPGQTQADPLQQRESSGNPALVNTLGYAGLYQFGAPRLETLGVYTPGKNENLDTWSKTGKNAPGKWSGTFNIEGFPQVKTIKDFLSNPDAQRAVYAEHVDTMDEESTSHGLDKYVGTTIGGTQITRASIRNMTHLAGIGGAEKYLNSGGAINIPDAYGTRPSDYAKLKGADSPNVGRALANNNKIDSMDAVNREDVSSAITDDLASMAATGKGDPSLTADKITRSLGPNASADWLTARARASDFHDKTQDFSTLPADQMNARLIALAPKPGQEEYVAQDKLHSLAVKKADAIMELRRKDPAESVGDDPEVKKALAAAAGKPDDFIARKDVITARLAAQQRAGIAAPSPIPLDETQRLLKPIQEAVQLEEADRTPKGKPDRIVLAQQQLVKDLKEKYGSYSDDVMREIIGTAANHRERLDQAAAAAEVMKSLINGTQPGAKPTRVVKTGAENGAAAASSAVAPIHGYQFDNSNVGWPPPSVAPPSPQPDTKIPSAKSIQILTTAPAGDQARLAGLFDKQFGQGSAQKYLNQKTAPTGTVTVDSGGENYQP